MQECKLARWVLEESRWLEAYKQQGWPGVQAAWMLANERAQLSTLAAEKEERPAVAKPRFVGVAMRNGRILITQATAVTMIEDLQERYASSRLLLLPRSASGEYMAATQVDARLQKPDDVQVRRFARVLTRLACVTRLTCVKGERMHMDMDMDIDMLHTVGGSVLSNLFLRRPCARAHRRCSTTNHSPSLFTMTAPMC